MKKLVLTGVLFLAFFAGFAQVPAVAMLDHKGTLTPYYGPAALQKAYAAADTGDIITLSPGLFYSQNIEKKKLTIRGAGMFQDTLAGTDRTHISGDFFLNADSVTIEGLYIPGTIDHGRVVSYGGLLKKCYIGQLYVYDGAKTTYNLRVLECIINGCCYANNMVNCKFENSYIASVCGHNENGSNVVYNCVAGLVPGDCFKWITRNCVFFAEQRANASYTSSDYCIGINIYSSGYYGAYDYYEVFPITSHLYNIKAYAAVFKDFRGSYTYSPTGGTSLALQDSIVNQIKGSDGTQVGIFGGTYPFDPNMGNRKVVVPEKTKMDGKLEVEIKKAE